MRAVLLTVTIGSAIFAGSFATVCAILIALGWAIEAMDRRQRNRE